MERKWWTLTAVCVGVFMLLLDVTIVNVALPDIERALDATLTDLQWTIDAYALTLAAFLLTAGSLADRFGRRRLFAAGTAIFTLGSLLCGFATSPLGLVLSRAGQGIGGAVMFATSLALLANAFRGPDRGVAFGLFGATTGVSVAVGPVLGGLLTSGLSWRWIFFVNVPVGIAAIVVTLARLDESRDPRPGRIDWPGFVLFSAALGLLVYGLIESNVLGWGASRVIGCLAGSAVLLATFVVVEHRHREQAMFDLGLLRKPTFTGGLVAAFGISASLFSMFTYLVLYLQNVLGYSAVATGVRFLVISGTMFVTAAIAGRLTTKVPIKALIAPGFVLVGLGLLLMHGITPDSSWTHLVPGLAVAGVGAGLVNVPLASTAVGVVRPERAGMASGVNSTFRQVGIATGIAGLGSIFSGRVRASTTDSLAGTAAARQSEAVAGSLTSGNADAAAQSVPPEVRAVVVDAARAGFVDGLNEILVVAAVLAFVVAIATAVLIRQRDFVDPAVAAGRDDPETAIGQPSAAT